MLAADEIISMNEFLTASIGGLFALWVIILLVVVIPLMVIAQLWALGTALRQRQWLKAVLFATPFGFLYLQHIAVTGPYGKYLFGFAIVRGEARYLSLFKLSYNLAGGTSLLLILVAIVVGAIRWLVKL